MLYVIFLYLQTGGKIIVTENLLAVAAYLQLRHLGPPRLSAVALGVLPGVAVVDVVQPLAQVNLYITQE